MVGASLMPRRFQKVSTPSGTSAVTDLKDQRCGHGGPVYKSSSGESKIYKAFQPVQEGVACALLC